MRAENVVRLSSGRLELDLSPCVGGAISGLHWLDGKRRVTVLRECHSPLENVLDAPSFPLVPFVNRVRNGSFNFRGRDVRLVPNMAGDPSPLHGQGWLAAWQVVRTDDTSAVLAFDHQPGEWPWAYRATQSFTLDDDGLTLTLVCTNRSEDPMPCGLGQHPYFPCGPDTRLDTFAEVVWTIDEHVLPVDEVPAIGRFNLVDRAACGQNLDHGFGGWNGRAMISDPSWPFDVEMSSPEARFFQVYSPSSGEFFVAEPVTHANDALGVPESEWAKLGLRVLPPGEQMAMTMRLDIRSK
jgi:aldose 1-epimerase